MEQDSNAVARTTQAPAVPDPGPEASSQKPSLTPEEQERLLPWEKPDAGFVNGYLSTIWLLYRNPRKAFEAPVHDDTESGPAFFWLTYIGFFSVYYVLLGVVVGLTGQGGFLLPSYLVDAHGVGGYLLWMLIAVTDVSISGILVLVVQAGILFGLSHVFKRMHMEWGQCLRVYFYASASLLPMALPLLGGIPSFGLHVGIVGGGIKAYARVSWFTAFAVALLIGLLPQLVVWLRATY